MLDQTLVMILRDNKRHSHNITINLAVTVLVNMHFIGYWLTIYFLKRK
ncbi:hypothetical protein ND2E_0827 [Colwellia psychrerythraea]|uniref:Uncharacterized protein n=1 Tax=Colwellia psychrerythraea TaxID=28229 RepID=A0A099K8R7_COLPS|nr:hypothetical protein ND2E_0827 [Colwellia psychrerythraea]